MTSIQQPYSAASSSAGGFPPSPSSSSLNGNGNGNYSNGNAGESSRSNGGSGAVDRNTLIMNRRLTAASLSNRNTNRYSVTALYSMAAEQDVEVEDDLARGESQHGRERWIDSYDHVTHPHTHALAPPTLQHKNACASSREGSAHSQRRTSSSRGTYDTSTRALRC